MEKLKCHFGNTRRAVLYYNHRRSHMSLNNGSLMTPAQAFAEKLKG